MISDEGNHNKRKLERVTIAEPLMVYDALSQQPLGRIVNIHTEGLLLIGDHLLSKEELYHVELRLPQEVGLTSILPLMIDCLWVQPGINDSENVLSHWSGCAIIDASIETQATIAHLMARLAV